MLPFALLLLAFTLCNLCINRQGTLEDALSRGCTEGVKGFFILLVFFSHAIGYIKTSGYTFTSFELQLVEFVQETIGQLMVVMFLLYSGYGVHQSIMAKGREYIKGMPARRILFQASSTEGTLSTAFVFRQARSLRTVSATGSLGNVTV